MKCFKNFLAGSLIFTLIACGQKTPSVPESSSFLSDATQEEIQANVQSERAAPAQSHARSGPLAVSKMAALTDAAGSASSDANPASSAPQRFIAHRHTLIVETPSASLPVVFGNTVQQCEQLKCEIINATLSRENRLDPPSAHLSIRIPPQSLHVLLSRLTKEGIILQHQREREDKTDQVIDSDARIKNLTELRDRLRAMLAQHTRNLKDALEVERELANTQMQLESALGSRKALANETEKVSVTIDFRAEQTFSDNSLLSPVATAWNEAGFIMMRSMGSLITCLALFLPWVFIVTVTGYIFFKLRQRCKSRLRNKKCD